MESFKGSKRRGIFRWLMQDVKEMEAPHDPEGEHQQHSWWQVMCLTGVDYFWWVGFLTGIGFLGGGLITRRG